GAITAALLSLAWLAMFLLEPKTSSQSRRENSIVLQLRMTAEPPPALKPPTRRSVPRIAAPTRTATVFSSVKPDGAATRDTTSASALAPSAAASAPPLDLAVTSAMAQGARGVGTLSRENLAQLRTNDPRSRLERGIDDSVVPECMSTEALKHQ